MRAAFTLRTLRAATAGERIERSGRGGRKRVGKTGRGGGCTGCCIDVADAFFFVDPFGGIVLHSGACMSRSVQSVESAGGG